MKAGDMRLGTRTAVLTAFAVIICGVAGCGPAAAGHGERPASARSAQSAAGAVRTRPPAPPAPARPSASPVIEAARPPPGVQAKGAVLAPPAPGQVPLERGMDTARPIARG